MNKIKENMSSVVLLGTFLGVFFGGYLHLDQRFAKAEEYKEVNKKVVLIELKLLYKEALDNLYFFRKQYRKYSDDEEIKKELEKAKEQVEDLKKQILELK